jgi:RimJ/RimL family protein N-acetyltransferase
MRRHIIETDRLRLISCDEEILEAILGGDEKLSKLLNIDVVSPWSEAGEPAFRFSLEKITYHPDEVTWWTYLPVLKSENMLIGSGGYRGKPSAEGTIEIGYEIAAAYRCKGYATEMARGLIQNGFQNDAVKTIFALTLAEENASGKVLRNCGMSFKEEIIDPEDGKLWRWEMKRG